MGEGVAVPHPSDTGKDSGSDRNTDQHVAEKGSNTCGEEKAAGGGKD